MRETAVHADRRLRVEAALGELDDLTRDIGHRRDRARNNERVVAHYGGAVTDDAAERRVVIGEDAYLPLGDVDMPFMTCTIIRAKLFWP